MRFTREELEDLRDNEFAKNFASMFGVDLNKAIDNELKTIQEPTKETNDFVDRANAIIRDIHSKLDKEVTEGKLEKEVKDGVTYYRTVQPKPIIKHEEEKHDFIMSKEEFVKFVKDYRELVSSKNKLEYMFGINLEDAPSGFSFAGKIQDIIWDFVAIIFGEDNRDDIADFVYGNSNFDTAEQLYDELL